MATKLDANLDEFHFVSIMGSPELSELSDNARAAGDFSSFRSAVLPIGQRDKHWTNLRAVWKRPETECFDVIRRVRIDTISEHLLRNTVSARIAALVQGSDRKAANELVIFALDSVNQTITSDMLWH